MTVKWSCRTDLFKRHQNVGPGMCCMSLQRVPLTIPQCHLLELKLSQCDTLFSASLEKSKLLVLVMPEYSLFFCIAVVVLIIQATLSCVSSANF